MKRLSIAVSFSILLGLIFGLGTATFAQDEGSIETQNLALAEQFAQEVLIGRNPENIADIYGRSVTTHSPTSNRAGNFSAATWGRIVTEPLGSDEVVTVHQIAAVDDIVFIHLTWEGTFENRIVTPSQHSVQPTGEFVTIRRVLVLRFEDGKVVEQWDYFMNPLLAVDYLRYLPEE